MGIFFFDEQIGAGLPVWLPNGVAIRDELEAFIREAERRAGYERVVSPHLARGALYEQSGHLSHFRENMFPPLAWPEDKNEYFLKPMNCPHHHRVFASSLRSYRQLPLRIAEYGQVYRFENSGSLQGLSRARSLCQNDAHIYLAEDQVEAEVGRVLDLHAACYRALGLGGFRYRLSLRDPGAAGSYEGSPSLWEKAEALLRRQLQAKGLPFFEGRGEAAFYGPKIDVQMRIGVKEESIASLQVDFVAAEKFALGFRNSSGALERPWVIHRAPLGSHERFVAMLLEYFDGRLPGWLSPVQLLVVPVSEAEADCAAEVAGEMLAAGFRARADLSAGHLAKRIRAAHALRPFAMLVIGPRERAGEKFKLQLAGEDLLLWSANLADELRARLERPRL
jgi:threonyl-tRNA synthetase